MQGLSLSQHRYSNLAYQARGDGIYALSGVDSKGSIRKSVDTDALTVLSLLSYPVKDLAGDFVNPAGCDFAPHAACPDVDVEHSRSPEFGNLTIAKCQHADGTYAVDYRNLTLDDGAKHYLPVAKSYFDKNSKPSMQVFAMVERDMLPGVSLEFKAISGRPLGPSPLENRQAYHFDKIEVVKYTHCATPVNPGALTVTKALDALIPVVQAGKLGSEQLDPRLLGVLRKSMAQFTPKRVLVSGGFVEKAMDDDNLGSVDSIYGSDQNQPETMEETGGMNGITALYNHVQDVLDACDQLEQDAQHTDNPQILKDAEKFCEMGRALAEKVKAAADKHDAKLNGGTSDEEPDDDEDAEDEETDMERDEDGTMKAVSPRQKKFLKALRVKRFAKADTDAAEHRPAIAPTTPADESVEDAIKRIEREDPAGFRKIQAAVSRSQEIHAWAN